MNNKKGSAILIVILLSITMTIYATTVYVNIENFKALNQKYRSEISKMYEL